MQKSVKVRGLALLATVALLGGTAWIATATTGAYFSDTHTGAISGSIGSIQVVANGSTGKQLSDLSFTNMLPGEAQTVTINYKNTGKNVQDVWITFPNATALSSLNNVGTWGEAHLSANGVALFDSANLNDHANTCGPFAPSGCWPLKSQYKVAGSLAPGASGTVSFTYEYAGKTVTAPTTFNLYPANDSGGLGVGQNLGGNSHDQYFSAAGVSGAGLPFAIVAMQVNQIP